MAPRPEDLQATFCATLVDEWARCGIEHAVICPGSRSTPLALALATDDRITVHVHHDERSAGFLALGLGMAGTEPAIVLTTSGTAAVELHPAVVEADMAGVPLLVCTADRPPELIGVGAPQAIDQAHLYGGSVRWFHAPGVADAAASARWRPLAARAHAECGGATPGPVHLNLAFREPLVGTSEALPPGRPNGGAWAWSPDPSPPAMPAVRLADELAGRRGVIVAGPSSGPGEPLARVARALGWPVLATPSAPIWGLADSPALPVPDALLRSELEHLRPDVIVRLGGSLASRVVGEWLARSGAAEIVASGLGQWDDPHGTAAVVLPIPAAELVAAWEADALAITPVEGGAWLATWQQHASVAADAVSLALDSETEPTEPGLVRALVAALPADARLVVSSSMPIRDLEWYVRPTVALEVHANRGANGIDGVVSTAVGVALADPGRPTVLLIGDVAFLHDSNGLLGVAARDVDLVIVVVDNDGGGIFSFLPQADSVESARFEQLYGTPHGLDLVAVAAAFGARAQAVTEVAPAVVHALSEGGVHVLVVRTDRSANVEVHRRLNAAVATAVADIRT